MSRAQDVRRVVDVAGAEERHEFTRRHVAEFVSREFGGGGRRGAGAKGGHSSARERGFFKEGAASEIGFRIHGWFIWGEYSFQF